MSGPTKSTTFVRWGELPPTAQFEGTWQGTKNVQGRDYRNGEIRTASAAFNLVFTMTTALTKALATVSVGASVRIRFDGSKPLDGGRVFHQFTVWEHVAEEWVERTSRRGTPRDPGPTDPTIPPPLDDEVPF